MAITLAGFPASEWNLFWYFTEDGHWDYGDLGFTDANGFLEVTTTFTTYAR